MDTEQEVEIIGGYIKEAIEEIEDEVQSLEDLHDEDIYEKICKAFENKVPLLSTLFAFVEFPFNPFVSDPHGGCANV